MELYRISQSIYAEDLSGNGSRLFGGRWNSEGHYALYTSFSRSLALLEILAHVPAKLLKEKDYILVTLSMPDKISMMMIEEKALPVNWDSLDVPHITQKIGDNFLKKQEHFALQVPSILIPEEHNCVLNPLHTIMKQVKIIHQRLIRFNDRLIKKF
jgi:RES domain-containing protein